jgi:hypothetical protein
MRAMASKSAGAAGAAARTSGRAMSCEAMAVISRKESAVSGLAIFARRAVGKKSIHRPCGSPPKSEGLGKENVEPRDARPLN